MISPWAIRFQTFLVILFAFIIPLTFGGSGFFFARTIFGKGPLTESSNIIVQPGTGIRDIAAIFKAKDIIHSAWLFPVIVAATGNKASLQAGEYEFPPEISMYNVMKKMADGDVVVHKITVAEGMTSKQIVELLRQNEFLTGEIKNTPSEGSLMPNTYNFTRNDSRHAIISRMTNNMQKFTDAAWKQRPANFPLQTIKEWITLASIVEAETPLVAERRRVAGVYINRLRRGIKLEADPTVAYGISHGAGRMERPLTFNDLKKPNAYNTYLNSGLPPTPINNPGTASLYAALNPESNFYLFFVANGKGGHNFSVNYEEHQKNVAQWRRVQKAARAKN